MAPGDPQGSFLAWLHAPDPSYQLLRGRVQRLAAVSSVALGLLWWFSLDADGGRVATPALAAGWILMPAVLLLSLGVPRLKYALALPASLVSFATVLLAAATFPSAGWLLVSTGIAMGGLMGAWFWFGWAPIPGPLSKHDGRPRTLLVAVHVLLVVSGLALLATSN